MCRLNKNFFNLIEIVFALGVIAVALAAILPLITVGMQTSKASVSDNYVADTADQFLHYIAAECKKNWDDPNEILQKLKQNNPESEKNTFLPINKIPDTNLYKMGEDGIYGIQQGTGAIIDFSGIIQVWKTPVTAQRYSGTDWNDQKDENYNYSAGLNIEISWPAEIPYTQREKKYFYLEIFKPN